MKLKNKTYLSVSEIGQLALVHYRNVLSVDKNLSRSWLAQGADDLEQGGLSGAAGPNNGIEFSGRYFQINSLQNLKIAKRLCYFFDSDQSGNF